MFVALGDSLTEGKGDVHPDGSLRGFADLLAGALAEGGRAPVYRNLARPSVRSHEIRRIQVPEAVSLAPDLVTVISGVNDIIALRMDDQAVGRHIRGLLDELRHELPCATILTATLPDLREASGLARLWRRRTALLNETIRTAAAASGVILVDLDRDPPFTAAELALDRVHPSPAGHLRLASRFAEVLGVPPPLPDFLATPARAQRARRIGRTLITAPRFVVKRASRGRYIQAQPPKHLRARLSAQGDGQDRAGIPRPMANFTSSTVGNQIGEND